MIEQKDINKIKEAVEEFFEKMTMEVSNIEISLSSVEKNPKDTQDLVEEKRGIVNLDIKLNDPQILIGQQGQTLFEIQRLLRAVLSRKIFRLRSNRGSSMPTSSSMLDKIGTESGQKIFYLNLDINDYKKKKIEYLKYLAKELADQVSLTKEEKALLPMSSYERRVIHSELSQRTDVSTESRGDGFDRHIVITPK